MRPHSIWDDEPPPCEPTEKELHEMQGGCPPESGCSVCWPEPPKCGKLVEGSPCQNDAGHEGECDWVPY